MRRGKTRVSIVTELRVLGETIMVLTDNEGSGSAFDTGWIMSSRSRELHHCKTNSNYPDARTAHDVLVMKIERFGEIPPANLEDVIDKYIGGE